MPSCSGPWGDGNAHTSDGSLSGTVYFNRDPDFGGRGSGEEKLMYLSPILYVTISADREL